MIEFAWPLVFILIPLPWFVYRFFPQSRGDVNPTLKVPDLKDFECFQTPSTRSFKKSSALFACLTWILLLLSAARPQWIGNPIEIPQSGRDLMLAVDLSGSMQIQDFEINGKTVDRLTALKWIAGDFIDRRKGDRIGLILFGSSAYLQTPLTFDLPTVKQLLNESAVGLAGMDTAIGDAIGLAIKQMRDTPQESHVLVLLTDGNNNAGELTLEKAAEIASRAHLKVYTVAIGAKEMIVQTAFGKQRVNPSADIDETSLKMVAEKTGGAYFRAYNTSELVQIYHHIDSLEAIERSSQYYRPKEELFLWPLSFVLFTVGLVICGAGIRRRLA